MMSTTIQVIPDILREKTTALTTHCSDFEATAAKIDNIAAKLDQCQGSAKGAFSSRCATLKTVAVEMGVLFANMQAFLSNAHGAFVDADGKAVRLFEDAGE
jgi:hypothetical protein